MSKLNVHQLNIVHLKLGFHFIYNLLSSSSLFVLFYFKTIILGLLFSLHRMKSFLFFGCSWSIFSSIFIFFIWCGICWIYLLLVSPECACVCVCVYLPPKKWNQRHELFLSCCGLISVNKGENLALSLTRTHTNRVARLCTCSAPNYIEKFLFVLATKRSA